jgi:hypothetical protein
VSVLLSASGQTVDGATMRISTFATMVNQKVLVPSPRTQYLAVDRNHLVEFLKPTLKNIYLDVAWYLRANPDIVVAIENGVVANAEDHYVTYGYYEHRMPYEIKVEEGWYLGQYPDVREAVAKRLFSSGRDHFYSEGYREGRLPHPNFSLRLME